MVELYDYNFSYYIFVSRTKKLIRHILNNIKIKRNIFKERKNRDLTFLDLNLNE